MLQNGCSCARPLVPGLLSPCTRPQIPQYGTHHTKMVILKFQTGVRVVVLTANFLSIDVTDKSQAVWYQEFPLRESETCDFEVCITLTLAGFVCGPCGKGAGRVCGQPMVKSSMPQRPGQQLVAFHSFLSPTPVASPQTHVTRASCSNNTTRKDVLVGYLDKVGGPAAEFGR